MQAIAAIAAYLAQQERAARRESDFSNLLQNARRKLVQLLDMLYRYRCLVGKAHPYTIIYLQCSQLLREQLMQLDLMYGCDDNSQLKIEDELLARMKPQLMIRLKRCAQQMQQAELPKEWIAAYYEPLAAQLAGKDNSRLTGRRWAYCTGVVSQVEQPLQAGRLTVDILQQLLLKNNFNSAEFSEAWKAHLLEQLESLPDVQVKIDLLITTRDYLESIRYTRQKSLFPNDTSIKKELKRWINYQVKLCYREIDAGSMDSEYAEDEKKRVPVNASVLLLACFCKVFQKVGFFESKDLSHILLGFRRIVSLTNTLIPAARNLCRCSRSLTVGVLDEMIELLNAGVTVAVEMRRELVEGKRKKGDKEEE
jgi:hypothetical protein